ncbi:DnaJ (Hsp40) homolog, subfamily A, member 2, isoform CRA_a [Rattus norvegicus]|uniref:DnaJ (Hsp40) homolog, subfamily A, member 2, isoform CRA_a n=1 Tax=Rattus norvegicus TaxID=10116 RepID=A6KDD5_RAT|nr:DnaJ (Hsp40) homolog, subfamily A, member 2, isoform CRA_a [Rattus norvegicus]
METPDGDFKTCPLRSKSYQVHTVYICQRNNRTEMGIQIFQCILPSLSLIALECISRAIRTWT